MITFHEAYCSVCLGKAKVYRIGKGYNLNVVFCDYCLRIYRVDCYNLCSRYHWYNRLYANLYLNEVPKIGFTKVPNEDKILF